jgi:GR25 family glycosyltransferase involved in LPS biosynthesis
MKLNVENIFIIHYKKLTNRKKNIENYFKENNIVNYEIRDKYQREDLTDELKTKYFFQTEINLCPAQICVTIEHIETYREIVINGIDNGWYLILEDDALFCINFIEKLNELLDCVPNDAEYLDISNYFTINGDEKWCKQKLTRTTVSYLIKKNTCQKLLNTIIPFNHAIDAELNRQITINDLMVYWSTESLVSQDSFNTCSSYKPY